eukprot:392743-Pelagomonas_calceolata.AAC.3
MHARPGCKEGTLGCMLAVPRCREGIMILHTCGGVMRMIIKPAQLGGHARLCASGCVVSRRASTHGDRTGMAWHDHARHTQTHTHKGVLKWGLVLGLAWPCAQAFSFNSCSLRF